MITRENIIVHELIGLPCRVESASSRNSVGISGVVVDETRNTLVLEKQGIEKTIPKKQGAFSFRLPNGQDARVSGSLIAFSPVERLKKLAGKVKQHG